MTARGQAGPAAGPARGAVRACVLAGLAGALAIAVVVGADAATPRYPMKAETTVRVAPSPKAKAMGTVWNGEMVEVHCQDRGRKTPADGGSTLWDYIQYVVDGTGGLVKRGWVPDYYVKTGTTEPLDGVRQGDCPPPLTTPGEPVDPPPVTDPLPPPPPTGCELEPSTDALALETWVRARGKRRKSVTVRYRERVRVRGKLTSPAGTPVAGARVCVATRQAAPRAPRRPSTFIVTEADGSFSFRPRRGPSRRIWFIHRSAAGSVIDGVRLNVRAGITVRPSKRSLRNGETLFLRGRVKGRPHRRNVLVELQAKRDTGWQTFGTTRTKGRGGRFSFPYTFSRTLGVARYKLRARVPVQRGYPYAAGATKPVTVKVVG